jgi:4-hydroxy-tetrahydrodipicolinate reductase
MTTRVAIAGAGGRMGQALIEAVLADAQFALAAALEVPESPALGRDAGERIGRTTGVQVGADVDAAAAAADVLIDFTRAHARARLRSWARRACPRRKGPRSPGSPAWCRWSWLRT